MIQRKGAKHHVTFKGVKAGAFKHKADAELLHNALRLGVQPPKKRTK